MGSEEVAFWGRERTKAWRWDQALHVCERLNWLLEERIAGEIEKQG